MPRERGNRAMLHRGEYSSSTVEFGTVGYLRNSAGCAAISEYLIKSTEYPFLRELKGLNFEKFKVLISIVLASSFARSEIFFHIFSQS